MGLTKDSNNTTFVSIVNGKFAVRTTPDNPLGVKRQNKNGQAVYEIYYDKITGIIAGFHIKETKFGKSLSVKIDDGLDRYVIDIPVDSKYFDSFASKIGNVDLRSEVDIVPYSFKPSNSDSRRVGINFYQHGLKVEYYFTPENPRGKPFRQGKLDEDDFKIFKISERKFYIKYIEDMSRRTGLNQQQSMPAIKDENEQEFEPDDLPF